MKKLYRIILLLLIFSFLTTYSPKEINVLPNKSFFFKIENIEIINNYLISTNTIDEKMNKIYGKNILFIKRKDIQSLFYIVCSIKAITSPSSGNRSNAFFEKINSPSKVISYTPPPLEISFVSIPENLDLSSTSRPEALGK